jgi:hypothetical protein
MHGEMLDLVVDKERGQVRIARVQSGYRFAFELRNAARVMANNARSVDKDGFELRAFVTGAVILAWSSLDAALNEFILLNAIGRESPLNDAEKAIIKAIGSEDLRPRRRQHTLELFNMMLRLLKKSRLRKISPPIKLIADNLSKAGWSWGYVATVDRGGRTLFVADADRDEGNVSLYARLKS